MNKKILIMVLSFTLMGCASEENSGNDLEESGLPLTNQKKVVEPIIEETVEPEEIEPEYDEDLTILPDILLQSQINRLAYDYTDSDIGTVYKVEGVYMQEHQPMLGIYYELIGFYDATGCCVSYLEIEVPEELEAPLAGTTISIIGEFKVKTIEDVKYPYLDIRSFTRI